MAPELTDPKAIAERGEQIYARRFKDEYEREHPGKFVAIDVITEKPYIADTPEDVLEAAQNDSPHGIFHLIHVGSSGAFRVGYTQHADLDWVFQ